MQPGKLEIRPINSSKPLQTSKETLRDALVGTHRTVIEPLYALKGTQVVGRTLGYHDLL